MKKELIIKPIGYARCCNGVFAIQIEEKYRDALRGLNEFGHINVVWWFSKCENDEQRNKLTLYRPYKGSKEKLGTFAGKKIRVFARNNGIVVTMRVFDSV